MRPAYAREHFDNQSRGGEKVSGRGEIIPRSHPNSAFPNMGLFACSLKAGLAKTHAKLTHEIKRIVTRSPKLTAESLEEIEHALIAADLGMAMTTQIVTAAKLASRIPGTAGWITSPSRGGDRESFPSNKADLLKAPSGPTVVSIVGVNGTGKTTTSAKLAHYIQSQKKTVLLAACDTFAPPPSSNW